MFVAEFVLSQHSFREFFAVAECHLDDSKAEHTRVLQTVYRKIHGTRYAGLARPPLVAITLTRAGSEFTKKNTT